MSVFDGVFGMELWVLFAFLAAVSSAGMVLVNDQFKVNELALLFNMRVIAFIAAASVGVFIAPPSDPLFYLYVVMGAFCAAYLDQVIMRLAGEVGAGVVSRIEPLSVAVTFVLWLCIMPSLVGQYLDDLPRLLGILASMVGALYFSFRLRKCEVSASALKAMLPAILAGAMTINLGKLAMGHAEHVQGVVWYTVIQCFVTIFFYAFRIRRSGVKTLDSATVLLLGRRVVIAAACLSVAWLVHVPSKYYAIAMVENPSYVTILNLTAPLWVMAFYRIKKHREIADIYSGLGIVASAVLFIIFTQM